MKSDVNNLVLSGTVKSIFQDVENGSFVLVNTFENVTSEIRIVIVDNPVSKEFFEEVEIGDRLVINCYVDDRYIHLVSFQKL